LLALSDCHLLGLGLALSDNHLPALSDCHLLGLGLALSDNPLACAQ